MTRWHLAAGLPDPDEIRRKAAEVLARPEYAQAPPEEESAAQELLLRVLRALRDGYYWLADSLGFLPASLRYPVAALLVAALVLLFVRFILMLRRASELPTRGSRVRDRQRHGQSPEELESLAQQEFERGRVIEAVRLLLRAGLLRLEQFEKRPHRPGTTNRELLRRYRASPLFEPLQTLVDTIDLKWYGDRPAAPDDYRNCLDAEVRLREVLASRAPRAAAAATP